MLINSKHIKRMLQASHAGDKANMCRRYSINETITFWLLFKSIGATDSEKCKLI